MPQRTIPTDSEFAQLFPTEYDCLVYLLQKGVFDQPQICGSCNTEMRLLIDQQKWRCTKWKCNTKRSLRANSFFAKYHLTCRDILNIGRKWLNKEPTTSIIRSTGCASDTICYYLKCFRELIADSLDHEDYIIGGEGIIVEIDETKISKRKYNRGHHVEGAWILGGVERTPEKKVFLVEIPDRKATTLLDALSRYIRPGSIVYSDKFKSYYRMTEVLCVEHSTVNHSKEYVRLTEENVEDDFVLVTKIHTNTIEGTWSGLKLMIPKRNRTKDIQERLFEFIWRRKHKNSLWDGLIYSLTLMKYQ